MGRTKLSVRAEATTRATPETLWALLVDATSYAQWGPWNDSGWEPPTAKGRDAWRYRRSARTTPVERTLEPGQNRRLVYDIEPGIPVRNYRSAVPLTPTPDGTPVVWSPEWDKTRLGRVGQR